MIDTDPGFTQVRNLIDPTFESRCAAHSAFFSFGENIGTPICTVPSNGSRWQATRQPVSLGAWPHTPGPHGGRYTTVMQWETWQAPWEYNGLKLSGKSESFEQFLELPGQVGPIFDLAVRARWASPFALLRRAGWGISDVDAISLNPWAYQAFIQGSKAEFGVSKAGYVKTRCGWFSERSVCYLASGRPVLHQDTGFREWLPSGRGAVAFSSAQDVVEAVDLIETNYAAQCRAARDLAEEYFSAHHVLPRLLEQAEASA